MPNIEIAEGEAVTISFAGTDGQITVAFISEAGECRGCASTDVAAELSAKGSGIFVHADMPDAMSRDGVIYHEPFNQRDPRLASKANVDSPRSLGSR
jgi:hypothetical protein